MKDQSNQGEGKGYIQYSALQETTTNWEISMGPMGNLQGSYKFMLLVTGKKVTRRKFTEMPVIEAVIKQVESRGINF